jgi:hypothetical protein
LAEALGLVKKSLPAIDGVANHLIENFGQRVSGEALREMIAASLRDVPSALDSVQRRSEPAGDSNPCF